MFWKIPTEWSAAADVITLVVKVASNVVKLAMLLVIALEGNAPAKIASNVAKLVTLLVIAVEEVNLRMV